MDTQTITNTLRDTGYVFITGQPEVDVPHLLNHLGKVLHVTDVKINPANRALVTSAKALDFHTDHHKANYILWHCLEQTDIGGESIMIDATTIYQKMTSDDQRELMKIRLFEHKFFEGDEDSYPMVKIENGVPIFYYSFWMVNKNLPEPQKKAYFAFRNAVKDENPVILKMQKGDVLIIDNHRILHGRSEIKGSQNRFLKRFWIQK